MHNLGKVRPAPGGFERVLNCTILSCYQYQVRPLDGVLPVLFAVHGTTVHGTTAHMSLPIRPRPDAWEQPCHDRFET
jgi:hypothetical protein